MDRLTKCWAMLCLPLLLAVVPTVVGTQAVSMSSSHGFPANQHRDWLTDPNPLFVTPSQPGSTIIYVGSDPFSLPMYNGRIRLRATCCEIPPPGAGLVVPGIDAKFFRPGLMAVEDGRSIPDGLSYFGPGPAESLSIDPPPDITYLDVVPLSSATTTLSVTANPAATQIPGNWELIVNGVDSSSQGINESIRLMVHVLPPWPADGPAPACTPGLEVLPLSSLPGPDSGLANVYAWKASNPTRTSFKFAAADKAATAGLEVTIRDAGLTPPLPPTMTQIRFTNTAGQPVGIRSSDSRNCTVPGLQWQAHVGNAPTSFTITTADTTTLVFSRTVCMHSFIFCWGRHTQRDVFAFSEGAFWTLFGGRAVDIKTVGKWDEAVGPFEGVIIP